MIAALDHARSGVAENHAKIVAAMRERGQPVPARLAEVSRIRAGEALYWIGFMELHTTRPAHGAAIPWTAIDQYARANFVPDFPVFLSVIRAMDRHILKGARND